MPTGTLPTKAIKLLPEWAQEHQQELLVAWQYAIELKPLQRIAEADNDYNHSSTVCTEENFASVFFR